MNKEFLIQQINYYLELTSTRILTDTESTELSVYQNQLMIINQFEIIEQLKIANKALDSLKYKT